MFYRWTGAKNAQSRSIPQGGWGAMPESLSRSGVRGTAWAWQVTILCFVELWRIRGGSPSPLTWHCVPVWGIRQNLRCLQALKPSSTLCKFFIGAEFFVLFPRSWWGWGGGWSGWVANTCSAEHSKLNLSSSREKRNIMPWKFVWPWKRLAVLKRAQPTGCIWCHIPTWIETAWASGLQ